MKKKTAPPARRVRGTRSAAVWRLPTALARIGVAPWALLTPAPVRPVRTGWPPQQQTTRFADKPHGMLHGNTVHTQRAPTPVTGERSVWTLVRSDVHGSQRVLLLNSNQTSWMFFLLNIYVLNQKIRYKE